MTGGQKRSESLTFRLPYSTAQQLESLSEAQRLSRAKILCQLIEREAKRLWGRKQRGSI